MSDQNHYNERPAERDVWLAEVRRLWFAFVNALERYLDRMNEESTSTNREPGKQEKNCTEKKMSDREQYTPGPANGAQVKKDGEMWTLILTRELRHKPEKVWRALTDPAHLREWAPFEVDRSLGAVGSTVKFSWVGSLTSQVSEIKVTRAEAPKVLEYSWGDANTRWELEPFAGGTRLTMWHSLARRFVAMGAAGWHICFDVLDRLLSGNPIGRMAGAEVMKFDGWQRLHKEYAKQFEIETPKWPPRADQNSLIEES